MIAQNQATGAIFLSVMSLLAICNSRQVWPSGRGAIPVPRLLAGQTSQYLKKAELLSQIRSGREFSPPMT